MANVTKVSLNAAAKLAGVSKSTISKAIKSGLLSYSERTSAGYQIELSELSRVYPATVSNISEPVANQFSEPVANASDLAHANQLLMQRIEAAEERQRRTDATLDDIREDRDRWRQQATALLTDQRPQPTSQEDALLPANRQPRGFWSRLFSGPA
ncbi:MAG: hypothetical protein EOO38_29170 [Cytophagaceae bacterium]|nr:MAG: hypothetical protein EOO38_29170 [Cytophagaceae bacterium]